MKKRVFFATLSALMLLAMIAVSVFPSFAADAVYYPNGTIILNEDLLNGAENFADNFSVNEDGEATYSWNEETGRVRVESTKNTVLDLEAIPEGLDYYTISADLYLTGSGNHHHDRANHPNDRRGRNRGHHGRTHHRNPDRGADRSRQ